MGGLAWLDSTHMAGGREPGADEPQRDANAKQGEHFDRRQTQHDNAALVQAGEPCHGWPEQEQPEGHEAYSEQSAEQPVPEP